MTQINRLQAALRTYLPWHGARLTFLALFLVALFRVETVNLDKLSSVFANWAKPESSCKSRLLKPWPRPPSPVVAHNRATYSLASGPGGPEPQDPNFQVCLCGPSP